jgi:nitrogenase molybdenum-iron protein alpha/beta subunit
MSFLSTLLPDLFSGGCIGVTYESGLDSEVYAERVNGREDAVTVDGPDALYFLRAQCREKGLDITGYRFCPVNDGEYLITTA